MQNIVILAGNIGQKPESSGRIELQLLYGAILHATQCYASLRGSRLIHCEYLQLSVIPGHIGMRPTDECKVAPVRG